MPANLVMEVRGGYAINVTAPGLKPHPEGDAPHNEPDVT